MHDTIELRTEDGVCPAHVFSSSGAGPGVLLFMDGIGMRPALHAIAERVAAGGYQVLLPDLFYRAGAYQPADAKRLFADTEYRADWFKRIATTTNAAALARDMPAFLAHFGARKIGVAGYCMGGRLAIVAAGHFPERIAAAAAFHPGGLVTDAPDSPHLLAPKIKARVLVAAAGEDASFTSEQQRTLDEALTAAGVEHVVETWPARHGWVPSDTPVHDAAQAERHFQALFALFARSLAAE